MKGWLGLALLLASCTVPGTPLCVPGWEAFLFLDDLAVGSGPSRLKQLTSTPRRETASYTVGGRSYHADVYLGASPPLAGILVVPGVAQLGKDDPRLMALANSLARVRFAVLVPDMVNVRDLKVQPGDIQEVADAFSYLVSRADLAPQGRAGISAHSYAVGPALLAALQPALRDRVRFLMGVGGYYDLRSVVTYCTTGYFRAEGGSWRYLRPNTYGKWITVISNADRLSDQGDRATMIAMARRRLADPQAPIDDLASKLGPEGRTLYALVTNADPGRTPDLIAQLPASIRTDLAALDLAAHDLRSLRARVILVHGREDDIIPYTESLALEHALPKGQVRLFLVGGLVHVDFHGIGWIDRWRLSCAVQALLAERSIGPSSGTPPL